MDIHTYHNPASVGKILVGCRVLDVQHGPEQHTVTSVRYFFP